MAFQRVVVPYEGGPLSEDALRIACELAGDEAKITAVYVVKVTPGTPPAEEKAAEDVARQELARAMEIGLELGVSLEPYVAKAHEVADGITETAATERADLVLMSLRHKHRPEETALLSHTASRVLRHAPCRVLIAYSHDGS